MFLRDTTLSKGVSFVYSPVKIVHDTTRDYYFLVFGRVGRFCLSLVKEKTDRLESV